MDFFTTVTEVHPSLNDGTVFSQKASAMIPQLGWRVCFSTKGRQEAENTKASVVEVTIPGALALDLIEQAEVEVERLDLLKANRMKEIAFERQSEHEEIFCHAHVEIDGDAAREKILSLIVIQGTLSV